MIGIYKIENKINSKVYIGSSKNIKKRWNRHTRELKNNSHWNEHLQREYNLYGVDNFTYSIILECKKEHLQCNENFLMDIFNSTNRNYGYNIVKNNSELPKETREKISKKRIQACKNPELIKKMSEITKKSMTQERRKHLSDIMKEKMKDENFKKMMYEKSQEARSKMNFKRTEEQVAKVRGSNNGMAKVNEIDVLNIRKRKETGEKRKSVFKDYEHLITQRGFKAIWSYQNWKHIQL